MSDSDREEKIVKISKQLGETTPEQMAATNLRAVIALIPFVGGALNTLATELIPNWKMDRLYRFVGALKVNLDRLGSKVDAEYLKREEFGHIFERTFRAVALNYQTEKLDALKNALLSSMVRTDIRQDMKEYLLHLIETFDSLHMRFLVLLRNPAEYYRREKIPDPSPSSYGSVMAELRRCLPDLGDGSIHAVWNDLYNYGIVNTDPNDLKAHAYSSPVGSEALVGRLSEFGKLVVSFAMQPPSVDSATK